MCSSHQKLVSYQSGSSLCAFPCLLIAELLLEWITSYYNFLGWNLDHKVKAFMFGVGPWCKCTRNSNAKMQAWQY